MFQRLLVVLVAVLLLNVGVAGAGTAGMTGLWSFDGTADNGSAVMPLTGVFNFTSHTIALEGMFFGSPYVIAGPITDRRDGTYAADNLVWSWSANSGPFDQQLWEITALGNGSASVVNLLTLFIPENPPAAIIEGTLTSTVPLPGALWLVGAGLFGLGGLKRRSDKAGQ